ncbi:MAG: M81 family metallopeptidase [Myxococcales bacterium]|nr:M81 family metallopeptidase [Myxococcales bacterium]
MSSARSREGGRPLRIAYGRITTETNAYSPVPTTLEDFQRFHLLRGAELERACGRGGAEVGELARDAELSGFMRAVRRASVPIEALPLLSAWAVPSGPLAGPAYEALVGELRARLRAALPLDGVMLALHGAMRGRGVHANPEEGILEAVRDVVGPDLPVAVTMDLHAHLTPTKVEAATLLRGYQTNPHRDLPATGRRAGELLIETILGHVRPVTAWRALPMVMGGGLTIDFLPPMRKVFRRLRELQRRRSVLSASLFMSHPWLDSADLGWSVHVITDGDRALAEQLADELACLVWSVRQHPPPRIAGPEEAIAEARSARWARALGAVCMVDASDVVGAGAAGENTNLLRALLLHGRDLISYVPIRAPAALEEIEEIEPGEEAELHLGGALDPESNPKLALRARILRRAQRPHFGQVVTAQLLDSPRITLVLTELPPITLRPSFFADVGLDPWRADILVIKNFFHFRIFFAAVNRKTIGVRTRGVTDLDHYRSIDFDGPVHPKDRLFDWRPGDRRRRLGR